METILFLLDTIAVALAAYMSLMDDKRKPGEAFTSWFRYRLDDPLAAVAEDARKKKLARLQRKYSR